MATFYYSRFYYQLRVKLETLSNNYHQRSILIQGYNFCFYKHGLFNGIFTDAFWFLFLYHATEITFNDWLWSVFPGKVSGLYHLC